MTDHSKSVRDSTEDPDHPDYDPIKDTTHPNYNAALDPLSPFYEGDQTATEPRSDQSSEDAYQVGPGRPPKEHRWKKGCPSPHPSGRPRKTPSIRPGLKKILEDALSEKVEIKKADKSMLISKASLGLQQLVNQFAKGDRHARRDVFQYAAQLGVDLQGKEVIADVTGIAEQAIVDAFLQRQRRSAAEVATDTHVKAPPDLLDDDVVETASKAKDPAPAPPRAPPKSVVPPGGHTRESIQADRERNFAWQKESRGS